MYSEYGKVVVGYQGIGKSTLAFHNNLVIDLESSNFFVDGERPANWYIIYCKIARALCKQGYIVCVSSHKEVREELARNPASKQVIIYPTHILKDKWIAKLRYRYEETQSAKDFKALKNAENCFDNNITDLENQENFDKIGFSTMDYNLADLLELNRR
jgi:hypothetical protein